MAVWLSNEKYSGRLRLYQGRHYLHEDRWPEVDVDDIRAGEQEAAAEIEGWGGLSATTLWWGYGEARHEPYVGPRRREAVRRAERERLALVDKKRLYIRRWHRGRALRAAKKRRLADQEDRMTKWPVNRNRHEHCLSVLRPS